MGRRLGLDPVLLWLWCRLVATAPIRPLAWEPPYAAGADLEKAKRQKDKKKKIVRTSMCNLIRSGHGKRVDFSGQGELGLPRWEVVSDVEIIKQVMEIRAKPNPSKQVRDLNTTNWPNRHQTFF